MDTDTNIEPFSCTKPAISGHFKSFLLLKAQMGLILVYINRWCSFKAKYYSDYALTDWELCYRNSRWSFTVTLCVTNGLSKLINIAYHKAEFKAFSFYWKWSLILGERPVLVVQNFLLNFLKMGNSRKYPYPTMDGFHVLTPPCLRKFQNALSPPPCPQNSLIVNPPSTSEFLFCLEVHFWLSNSSMNKWTWIYASSRL